MSISPVPSSTIFVKLVIDSSRSYQEKSLIPCALQSITYPIPHHKQESRALSPTVLISIGNPNTKRSQSESPFSPTFSEDINTEYS